MVFQTKLIVAILASLAAACTPVVTPEADFRETLGSQAVPRARFITLGTAGGPVPRLNRSQPANAVVVNGATYLFDVGDGVVTRMTAAGLQLKNVRAVFLSHLHIDHSADLPIVLIDSWLLTAKGALPVIGPPGSVDLIAGILAAYRPVELAPVAIGGPPMPALSAAATARELPSAMPEPVEVYRDENIAVTAVAVDHYHYPAGSAEARSSRSYAYRIETQDRSFVFTGDTGPSAGLEKLAINVDVLVTEVIDLAKVEAFLHTGGFPADRLGPMMQHMEEDHLTGTEIGKLATRAKVGSVVLTHFAPGTDDDTDYSTYAKGVAASYSGPVFIAPISTHSDPCVAPRCGPWCGLFGSWPPGHGAIQVPDALSWSILCV